MAKWMRPDEEQPEVDAGDRVIGIVKDREHAAASLKPRIIILTATEDGWKEQDGYTLHDCELWTLETDLVSIADAVA